MGTVFDKAGERQAVVDSPIGRIALSADSVRGVSCRLLTGVPLQPPRGELLSEMAQLLERYFVDPCSDIFRPWSVSGTPFQRRVWAALSKIPCGETRSYKSLALDLGSSPRAVGGACRCNPLPIFVPCHRVVSVSGLGGFMGVGQGGDEECAVSGEGGLSELGLKRWLLRHEAGACCEDRSLSSSAAATG